MANHIDTVSRRSTSSERDLIGTQLFWLTSDPWDLIKYYPRGSLTREQVDGIENPIHRIFLSAYNRYLFDDEHYSHEEVLAAVIEGDECNDDMTLFSFAIMLADIELIKFLIRIGLNLSECERDSILIAVAAGSIPMVQWLMNNGFELDINYQGYNALHCALHNENSEMVEFILSTNQVNLFEIDMRDGVIRGTPVDWAKKHCDGKIKEIIEEAVSKHH